MMISNIKELLKHNFIIIVFLLLYIVFSFLTFKTYGITGDEPYAYYHGRALGMYVSGHEKQAYSSLVSVTNGDAAEYFNLYDGIYTLALNKLNPGFSIDGFHLLNLLFGSI